MISTNISLIQKRLIIAISLSAAFLTIFTQFLLITAFPKIMDEFEISASEVQLLTTSYMLALAILIPLSAYLIHRFDTRLLMISAMSLFLLGTLLGVLATSYEILLLARIIQGISSGIIMPLMQSLLFHLYPREKRGYAMGLSGLVINVAPAIGPPVSGILINQFGWRSLFFIILPIVAIILILILLFMRNVIEQRKVKFDYYSVLLTTIGFGGILYGFSRLQISEKVDAYIIISIVVGVLSLYLFYRRQKQLTHPILELHVLKVQRFLLVTIISILSFSLLISTETILPIYVQNVQQFSALHAGIIVFPGAITLAFMSLFAGSFYDKYGGKTIAIIGFILLSISTISYHVILDLNTSSLLTTFLFILTMAGVALINIPILTVGINSLPDSLITHGTAIINISRQFGGAIGLTFIISFIDISSISDASEPLDFLNGIKKAFFIAFLFAIIGLFLSLLLKKEK